VFYVRKEYKYKQSSVRKHWHYIIMGGKMSKLLIVDDEQDVREFAKNFFTRRNIETHTAAGGQEALDIIRTHKPTLVLLDIRMEDKNGLDVLEEIKKIDKDIKVIMVTGVEEAEAANKARQLGAIGYIHKPLVLEELEQIVLKEIR
jgi:DNA-binding NtrC family response regulator